MIVRKRPREKYLRRVPRYCSDLREYRQRIYARRKAQATRGRVARILRSCHYDGR